VIGRVSKRTFDVLYFFEREVVLGSLKLVSR
jgi:hypothetical protein